MKVSWGAPRAKTVLCKQDSGRTGPQKVCCICSRGPKWEGSICSLEVVHSGLCFLLQRGCSRWSLPFRMLLPTILAQPSKGGLITPGICSEFLALDPRGFNRREKLKLSRAFWIVRRLTSACKPTSFFPLGQASEAGNRRGCLFATRRKPLKLLML